MPDKWDAVAAAMREAVLDAVAAISPAPQPPPPVTPPTGRVPGQALDLRPWKLTLPTGRPEKPTEILQPQLDTYTDEWFRVRADGGVAFRARCDGVSTSGSGYARSELREMDGDDKADWSNATGTHTLVIDQAITETPIVKPEVVAGQIHGGDDDVMQIHLSGRRLTVKYADGKKTALLDGSYQPGTRFQVEIAASRKQVQVAYNGQVKASLPLSGSGWYFKAGAYVQSSTAKGDAPDAAGEVVIYGLQVTHS